MNKEQWEKIALFRFGIIGDFVNRNPLPFGMQETLIKFKTNCKWNIAYFKKAQISRGTIIRWGRHYKVGGEKLEALYPQERNDIGKSRVIDKKTANILTSLTLESNVTSVPGL